MLTGMAKGTMPASVGNGSLHGTHGWDLFCYQAARVGCGWHFVI